MLIFLSPDVLPVSQKGVEEVLNLIFLHCDLARKIMVLNICAAYILYISIKSILLFN